MWTVPGAVSPGCILVEPRKSDNLTPGGNESSRFGANKRKSNVDGSVHYSMVIKASSPEQLVSVVGKL